MVITTSFDHIWGFKIQVGDEIVFWVSQLPQNFVFQPLGASNYFVSEMPPGFVSRQKRVLSDANGNELASLKVKFNNVELTVGDKLYRLKMKAKGWIMIPFGRYSYKIAELGIKLDVRERTFSCDVVSEDVSLDEVRLAIIIFLHFSRINGWRENG